MIAALIQAAGEYAAAAGRAGTGGRTGIEGLDRLLGGLRAAWNHLVTFALAHPALAVVLGLLLGLLVERVLLRRSWRF